MSSERTGEMTIRQGAAWLGMGDSDAARRRLLRRLLAREEDLGHRILVRSGIHYRVTKAVLTDHCQEHFSARERTEELLRNKLEDLRRRIDEVGRIGRLESRELGREIAGLQAEFEQLTRKRRDGT
jgi:hypothetical protein